MKNGFHLRRVAAALSVLAVFTASVSFAQSAPVQSGDMDASPAARRAFVRDSLRQERLKSRAATAQNMAPATPANAPIAPNAPNAQNAVQSPPDAASQNTPPQNTPP